MVRKRVSQDNPLVKLTQASWSCPACGATHQGRVQGSHGGDRCIPCHFGTAPAQPPPPDDREAREQRLVKLCEKHGVPVHMERPLRERTLVREMMKSFSIAKSTDSPNLAYMNALLDAVEGGYERTWRRAPITSDEIVAARRATRRGIVRDPGSDVGMKSVTEGHGAQCVCQLCFPKRVRTDPQFSTGR